MAEDNNEVTIKLPVVVSVRDYHDFKGIIEVMEQMGVKANTLKHCEMFCNGDYVGFIYHKNHKPTQSEIFNILFDGGDTPKELQGLELSIHNKEVSDEDIQAHYDKYQVEKKLAKKAKALANKTKTIKI